jgi:hypothetical protein
VARIRSTHPGQWTDEAFATLSPLAHLLAIGVRNEADDGGVFEWRPVQLKVRILPLYQCDVAELLAKLEKHDIVRPYEVDGKRYGAIRNFHRFQSPDKPREIYPKVDWVDAYTARKPRKAAEPSGSGGREAADEQADGSRGVADSSPTGSASRACAGLERNGEEKEKIAPAGAYRWQGRIIRLKPEAYDAWARAFHALDLDAQLQALDDWLASGEVSDSQRTRWFHLVSGAFRKRHENTLKAAEAKLANGHGVDVNGRFVPITEPDLQRLQRQAEAQTRDAGLNPGHGEGAAFSAEILVRLLEEHQRDRANGHD